MKKKDKDLADQMKKLSIVLCYNFGMAKPIRVVASIFENSINVIQDGLGTYEELLDYRATRSKVNRIPKPRTR